MTEFLVPDTHQTAGSHYFDPYTPSGARSIMRRFRDDVIEMLRVMKENHDLYDAGKTFLNQSPLKKKIWVAAAMKTSGLIEERPSPNGACALVLTQKALEDMDRLKKFL